MKKYIFFLATILSLFESCSSAKPLIKQSKDAALVSFFINELWDEPDCGEKQIIIRQDTTDGFRLFFFRLVKEKAESFQTLKFNSNDIFQISNYKNIQIKPYTYKIVTGDDMFPFFPLEKNECASILLSGIYHFKDFSLININIESNSGEGYSASFKYKIKDNKMVDIQLVTYFPNKGNDAKVDLRKKYSMYVLPEIK